MKAYFLPFFLLLFVTEKLIDGFPWATEGNIVTFEKVVIGSEPPPLCLPKSKLFPGAPLYGSFNQIKVSFIFLLKLLLFVCCTAGIVLWFYSNLFKEK